MADIVHQGGTCSSHFFLKVRLSTQEHDVAIREFFCDLSPKHEEAHTDYSWFLEHGWSVQWSGNEESGNLFDELEDFDVSDGTIYRKDIGDRSF